MILPVAIVPSETNRISSIKKAAPFNWSGFLLDLHFAPWQFLFESAGVEALAVLWPKNPPEGSTPPLKTLVETNRPFSLPLSFLTLPGMRKSGVFG